MRWKVAGVVTLAATLWSLAGVLAYWVALWPAVDSLGAILGQNPGPASIAWRVSVVKLFFSLVIVLLLVLGVVASVRYIHAELKEMDERKATAAAEREPQLERLSVVDRISHALVLTGGFIAGATGFILYFADDPFVYAYLYSPVGRNALADLHVIGGFFMAAGAAFFLSFYLSDFILHALRLGFRKSLTRYYFLRLVPSLPRDLIAYFSWMFGLKREHPEYSKYMPSQVLAFYTTGFLVGLVGLTGLSMVVWGMQVLEGIAWWTHVYAATALTVLIAFHVYMGHLRPLNFPIDKSFITGKVPLSKAKREWPIWVKEVTGGRV